jgi:hypothetical protein
MKIKLQLKPKPSREVTLDGKFVKKPFKLVSGLFKGAVEGAKKGWSSK